MEEQKEDQPVFCPGGHPPETTYAEKLSLRARPHNVCV